MSVIIKVKDIHIIKPFSCIFLNIWFKISYANCFKGVLNDKDSLFDSHEGYYEISVNWVLDPTFDFTDWLLVKSLWRDNSDLQHSQKISVSKTDKKGYGTSIFKRQYCGRRERYLIESVVVEVISLSNRKYLNGIPIGMLLGWQSWVPEKNLTKRIQLVPEF